MYHCPRCTQMLDAPDLAGQRVACPFCGQQFQMPGEPPVAVAVTPYSRTATRVYRDTRRRPSHVAAVCLSFIFPGLGQLFLGRHMACITFLIAAVVCGIAAALFWPMALACLFVWVWSMVDAAN